MKKNRNILILIIIAIMMFLFILIYKKITPFGDNSFLDMDFFHQYFPMSGELYDRVHEKSSLIYSFTMGIGLPIYRNFFNYLSSPFNLLILLFKRTSMISVYTFIICFKAILSSICMYLLLKKKNKDNFIFISLSLMYGFSSYYIAYHWNIMWMDGMSFLPIVVLGLEHLIDKEKPLLYIVSLAVTIYSNYYIGFMVCIFILLYFIMYLFINNNYNKKELLNKVILFIISSLYVGLICSFFLIPMYYSIRSISAVETIKLPNNLYYGFKLRELIFNHLSFVKNTITHSDISNAPNISCGILSFLLIIPFIFNKKINIKIKIGYLGLLLFLFISFKIPMLDYLWHICHIPNDLPYRFSFLYSFVLIIICSYSINNIKYVNKKHIYLSFIVTFCLLVYLNIVGYINISFKYIVFNLVFLIIYFIIYIYYMKYKKHLKIFKLLTTIFVIIDILINININWNMDSKVYDFYEDYNIKKDIINKINSNDKNYYRIGEDEIFTYNDSSWYGFKGLNSFSSMEYKNIANLMNKLGYPGNEINSYYYKPGNIIPEIMFNIKYGIYRKEDIMDYYETPFNSSFMFIVDNDINKWNIESDNPFEVQNDFINKSYSLKDVYKKLEPINIEKIYDEDNNSIIKYTYSSNNSNYYVYSKDYNLNSMVINDSIYELNVDNNIINNSELFSLDYYNYKDYNERFIIEVNKTSKMFDIYCASEDEDVIPLVYIIDEKQLELFNNKIQNSIISINYFSENKIDANISASKDGIVYTSIPFDKGWNVFIDGKKIETKSIANALLSFSITKGKHNIHLEYNIPFFKIGIFISITSIISLIYFIKKKRI